LHAEVSKNVDLNGNSCIPVGNPVVRSSNNFSSSELELYFM